MNDCAAANCRLVVCIPSIAAHALSFLFLISRPNINRATGIDLA